MMREVVVFYDVGGGDTELYAWWRYLGLRKAVTE